MFKELSSGLRKVLAILMAGLFVVSLTAVAASAHGGHRWGGWGSWGGRIWIGPSVYLRPLLWICVESLHQRVCLDMLMKKLQM